MRISSDKHGIIPGIFSVTTTLGLFLTILLVGMPRSIGAQTPTDAHADSVAAQVSFDVLRGKERRKSDVTSKRSREAIVHDSLAGLRWMVRGHTDWSRYDTPGFCLAATRNIDFTEWRRLAGVDTAAPGTAGDSIARAAFAAAHACGDRFTARGVPLHELRNLRALSIIGRDYPRAKAAILRHYTEAPNVTAKATSLLESISTLVSPDARPRQFAFADTLVAQIDALGRTGQVFSDNAEGIVEYAMVEYVTPFDTAALLRRSAARIAKMQGTKLTAAESHEIERLQYIVPFLGSELVDRPFSIDIYRHAPDGTFPADSIAARAGRLYRTEWEFRTHPLGVDAFIGPPAIDRYFQRVTHRVGETAPPLTPDYWFVPGDTLPAKALVRPELGKVTLFIVVSKFWGRDNRMLAACLRLHEKYAKKGLEIVLINNLDGFAWSSPPLEPLAEAKVTAWYFHQYLKLPFPLAIFSRSFTTTSDGRRERHPTVFEQKLAPTYSGLFGRDGRIFPSDGWVGGTSVRLDASIRQALGLPEEK